MSSLPHLVASFGRVRVLVLGDIILDEYVTGTCDRVSPEAPVAIVRVRETREVLGGAANTAANVASLGGRCTLVGAVGEDEAARRVQALCEARGITLHGWTDGRPTTRKVRIIGERQQLVRLDYELSRPVDEAVFDEAWPGLEAAVRASHVVVLSDYAKGVVTAELCRRVFPCAREAGATVIVDPRPQHREFYRGCDLITPNWKEAQALLGEPGREPADDRIEDVGRRIAMTYGATVVLTLGPLGMRVFPRDGGTPFAVTTVAREVFDVSGAGDTVVAALALALGAGADLRAAVDVANRAAGIVVGKLGTATVTPEELLSAAGDDRLVTRADLAPLARALRSSGKRIVTINGSFDLLHAGHVHILEEARRQGDVLIVGLNSDASVRAYKGPARPVVPETERARLLLALRCVDYVHVFDETDPIAFLEAVRPDVHVNGAEYGEDCIEAPTVRKHGGRLHLVERIGGWSTTGLLARMRGEQADASPGASPREALPAAASPPGAPADTGPAAPGGCGGG